MSQDKLTTEQTTDAAELVQLATAARAIGIDRRTLLSHLKADGVPVVLSNRVYRVSWIELAEWVNRNAATIERAQMHGAARVASRRANAVEAAEKLRGLTTSTVGGVQ